MADNDRFKGWLCAVAGAALLAMAAVTMGFVVCWRFVAHFCVAACDCDSQASAACCAVAIPGS